MDVRIDNAELVAPGAMPFTREDVELRRVKTGISQQRIQALMQQNGNDDLLIRGDDNHLYVISARQLEVSGDLAFGMPKVRSTVQAAGVTGEVIYANNERAAAENVLAAVGFAGVTGVVAGLAGRATGASAGQAQLMLQLGLQTLFGAGLGTLINEHKRNTSRDLASLQDMTEPLSAPPGPPIGDPSATFPVQP